MLRSQRGSARLVGFVLIAVFAQIARNWLMLNAVGVDASLFDAVAVLIAVVSLGQLPFGLSVGAAAAVLILGPQGVAAATAAGVLLTATGTVGGLAFAAWAAARSAGAALAHADTRGRPLVSAGGSSRRAPPSDRGLLLRRPEPPPDHARARRGPGLASERPSWARIGRMAEEVALAGTEARAKLRNPLGVVGLSLITIGIYYFFWWYFINREMRDFGRARGTDLGQNPGNSVLAITLGALIIVPAIVTLWTTSDRIQRTQETAGVDRPGQRTRHLHPAAADRPGGHLVRPARAQQGVDRAGGRRRSRHPAVERGERPAAPPPPPAPVEPRPEAPEQGPQSAELA